MIRQLKFPLALCALALAGQALAQVTLYEGEGYRGRAYTTSRQVPNLAKTGFNDRASSVVVGTGRWEACEHAAFEGKCVLLRKGSYESLAALGLNDKLSSLRPAVGKRRYDNTPEPAAQVNYEWRRRPNEGVFEVPVTSVHAVVGAPTERCWIEQQADAPRPRGDANVGGAIVGALLGGVLGHQVGGGTGRDLATVGGAVAGGAIGANVGRNGSSTGTHDVRRCENTTSATPAFYDVAYNFRGRDHHMQMSAPPGRTILVNAQGVPRQ